MPADAFVRLEFHRVSAHPISLRRTFQQGTIPARTGQCKRSGIFKRSALLSSKSQRDEYTNSQAQHRSILHAPPSELRYTIWHDRGVLQLNFPGVNWREEKS